ncbi:MAG: hypothetical protein LC722_06910 [Actinobacteria bacterium]|nr:hypothetical protein [Actinomycetota bacterium]
MCRALQVLCAAADREALVALKRAVVSKEYELTGGALDEDDLLRQTEELEPDAVVVDASLAGSLERLRALYPSLRLVAVGFETDAADAWVADPSEAREAVLGIQRPGGPVT